MRSSPSDKKDGTGSGAQMKEFIPCVEFDSPSEDTTPEICKIVVDDVAGLEMLLLVIHYGDNGGDRAVDAFYDAKTFKPLPIDDAEDTGVHTNFNTPMEDFVRSQLDLVVDISRD
mmetsp:Transcript_20438/g.25846  ORF Transcript_20438/g.25846 Transcript_20438/m.25846 type:complete len:115 (+) Transcript_20438:212-556(+)